MITAVRGNTEGVGGTRDEFASQQDYAIVDGPFGSNLNAQHCRTSGIPVIKTGVATSSRFAASEYLYVDEAQLQSDIRSKVFAGDIVMAKMRIFAMPELPVNIDKLLRQRTVERDRIEYKSGWNPDATIRTLCAFANDFENLGGGYIVIGQNCDLSGVPIRPPVGIPDEQLDRIQQELLNGSPAPRFSTDEGRTYFLAELPVHPDLKTVLGRHDEAHDELTETEARVLMFIQAEPKSRSDTASYLGINSRSGNLYKSIDRLRNLGFLELTIPDKPQSKNQKMRITRQGQVWLRFRLSDK